MLRRQSRTRRATIKSTLDQLLALDMDLIYLPYPQYMTLVNATVTYPNDVSQSGTWLRANVANVTQYTFTDTTDGAPTTHYVRQVAPPNLQQNRPCHYKIGIPYATGGGQYIAVYVDGGGSAVFVNATAGTIQSTAGNVSNVTYDGSILEFDCAQLGGVDIRFYTCSSGAGISYQGSGARSVTLADNGDGQFITITQRNVSYWANMGKAGSAWDVSQATGSAMPYFNPTGGRFGGPAVQPIAASSTRVQQTGTTRNQPVTIFVRTKAVSNGGNQYPVDGGTVNSRAIYLPSPGTTIQVYANGTGFGLACSPFDAWHTFGAVFDTTSSIASFDGTEGAGTVTAGATGMTIGAAGNGAAPFNGPIDIVCGKFAALNASERAVVYSILNSAV